MKKTILITLALLVCGTFIYLQANKAPDAPVKEEPNMENVVKKVDLEAKENSEKALSLPVFGEKVFDFGEVSQGEPVSHTFTLVNKGSEDLLIENVKPSCGCTTKNYTKTAIAPGESGEVTLTYNAAKAGVFNKSASVLSNSQESPNVILTFKGEVVEK